VGLGEHWLDVGAVALRAVTGILPVLPARAAA
jgi:hypothetical protein